MFLTKDLLLGEALEQKRLEASFDYDFSDFQYSNDSSRSLLCANKNFIGFGLFDFVFDHLFGDHRKEVAIENEQKTILKDRFIRALLGSLFL